MTRKEALRILIQNAAANVAGVGQGIRSGGSEEERAKVGEAAWKLWQEAYGYQPTSSDMYNLGIHWSPSP